MTEQKSFEQIQKEVDKKIEQLHEIDEKHKRGEWDLSKVKPNPNRYKRRKRNGKKRMRELEYRSEKPDDYHDRDKHRYD